MAPKVAVVCCVHHKPWLIMSTLITAVIQDLQGLDIYFVYHVGDGTCRDKPSYQAYHQLVARTGGNPQLSPFDERVRDVCRLGGARVFELEFENDHTLDSGAWYKFLRTGRWRAYDYVLFLGEGTLLTRANALSSMLRFAAARGVHFIASGHEKRRLPKRLFLHSQTHRSAGAAELWAFRDRMMAEVFRVFSRDPDFQRLFDQWPADGRAETQNHVPDIWGRSGLWDRLRNAAFLQRHRALVAQADALVARASVAFPWALNGHRREPVIHVNGVRRPLAEIAPVIEEGGVKFHEVKEPEWFGCATNHLMSRQFLERFTERLERYDLYDVLDIPFAGSALEIIWGFLPAWLGDSKWFTDGMHRVRKHFVTYRREDDPEGMASYLNRYYRGRLAVGWDAESVRVVAASRADRERLSARLGEGYFHGGSLA